MYSYSYSSFYSYIFYVDDNYRIKPDLLLPDYHWYIVLFQKGLLVQWFLLGQINGGVQELCGLYSLKQTDKKESTIESAGLHTDATIKTIIMPSALADYL